MKLLLTVVLLALGVSASAVAVVYGKYRSRMLFHETRSLERTLDRLAVEWEQLLIEEHAWADPARIERLARSRLGMVVPEAEAVVFVSVR